MALLNQGVKAEVAKGTPAEVAGKEVGLSKAASYNRKKKEKIRAGAQRILSNKKIVDQLDASDVAFLKWLDREPGASTAGGSTFTKLYGTEPKVGDKITLQDAFDKTFKGKSQMDSVIKKLKEKNGIEIVFEFNKDKPALSTYTIKSLGK